MQPINRRITATALVLSLLGALLAVTVADQSSAAARCTRTAKLVNPCRPWLGAVADRYPNISGGWRSQILAHEKRIGRRVDVVHQYHPPGHVTVTADERYFVRRGTIVYMNWKPARTWSAAAGGNAEVNRQIDQMARGIKALAPKKVMLAISGEPERYVSIGTSSCPYLKGSAGSPASYISMWHNVRKRFDARGARNVVWVMNYLGAAKWDCLFPKLWPGNRYVDWILWDPYFGPTDTWGGIVGHFYNVLYRKSNKTHAFKNKTWGLAEFGFWRGTDQRQAYRLYDRARAALDSGRFPRLKLYEPFDTVSDEGLDTRLSYTSTGAFDATEQKRYNLFANDPKIGG